MLVPWTKEEEAIVIEMWNKGCPTQEIANSVGRNRNSIIGKAARLGLPKHAFTVRKELAMRTPRAPKKVWITPPKPPPTIPEPIPVIQPSLAIPPSLDVPFMTINNNQCKAVTGRDTDEYRLVLFCGHPVLEGASYCPQHSARYFNAPWRR